MEEYNQYILKWREKIIKADKCLQNQDFEGYESALQEAQDAYEEYKRDTELTYECKNFGMINHIFENALPKLYKSKKHQVIKDYIHCIKEDKNLLAQFQFYKALGKYNNSYEMDSYLTEALTLAKQNIDKKTIKESIKKLAQIIKKNNIKPNDFINESNLSFYDNCNTLLCKDKKLTNIIEMTETFNAVADYVKNNQQALNENIFNPEKAINEFTAKLNTTLTTEEKTFVEEIIDAKSKGASQRKEKLFNKFKNECIDLVDKLIKESTTDDAIGLQEIKNQLQGKEFCLETIVQDMAQLLEIRDVLMS